MPMNIVFDIGCVLIDWDANKALNQCYPDGQHHDLLKQAVFHHPDWQALDRGTLSEQEAINNFHTRTSLPHAEFADLLQAVRESLTPLEASWAMLHELHQQGYPLYCLSNMPASTFTFLKSRYDCWDVFKGIVISGEIGLMKPERAIFEHLLNRYQLQAEQTLLIDDLEANVIGARQAGMRAIQFTNINDCRQTLEKILKN